MAMGKKKDIGDIIRDAINKGKPKPRATAKLQRKGAKSPEGNQDKRDLRDRNEMPKRRLKPRPKGGIPTMPKRKPKAGPPRMGNY